MKLSDIFHALATTELGNLGHLTDDRSNIREDRKKDLITLINRGLADIFGKFKLKVDTVELAVNETDRIYMVSPTNLIEILSVHHNNNELSENRDYRLLAVDKIEFKNSLGLLDTIRVDYQASLKPLTELDISIDRNIDLPIVYLNALIYFIAAALYTSPVNQLDGDLNEGAAYAIKYQEEIQRLQAQGVELDALVDNGFIFGNRGFV